MFKEFILAIDDTRDCPGADILCRTYSSGLKAITLFKVDLLLLDHDLGALKREYNEHGREMTGYDIVCFLENPDNAQYRPTQIEIISANPDGIKRIVATLEKMGYKSQNRRLYELAK